MLGGVGGAVSKDVGLGGREVMLVGFIGCVFVELIEAMVADEAVMEALVVPTGPFEEVAGEGMGKAVEVVAGAEVGGERVIHEG